MKWTMTNRQKAKKLMAARTRIIEAAQMLRDAGYPKLSNEANGLDDKVSYEHDTLMAYINEAEGQES